MTDGLVAGRFRLTALRGSGGTAAVFAAVDEQAGHPVALKLLHPHLAADRAVWAAFFEEVRAAQSIVHPLVAEIFDAGTVETDPPVVWIAMELVEGVTLEEHVRAHGPLPSAAARVLMDGLLEALAAAHAQGVVHRDLTPANVMIASDALEPFDPMLFRRRIRLLDFGLADVPGRTTRGSDALLAGTAAAPAGVVASVPYASPEQLSGAPVTEASDLYQAGATLFFALTGRVPFRGASDVVVRAHLTAPPPVPSAERPGIDRAMDRVVTTAMLKRPADRFANAGEMRRALAPADTGVTAAAVAESTVAIRTDTAVTRAQPGLPSGGIPATDPDADADADARAATRVYRTSVPESGAGASGPPHGAAAGRRPRWPAWAAGGVGAVALIGIIALSAAAGSAPSAVPPPVSSAPTPTVTASTSAPSPTETVPVLVDVPPIVGMPVGDARGVLAAAGFAVGAETAVDGTTPAGVVVAADPASGSRRPVGTAVSVQVASGRNAIPAVMGLSIAEAAALVSAAGFVPTAEYAGAGEPDVVVAAAPAAGAVVALGTGVTLWAPASAPPAVTPTPVPAPSSPSPAPVPSPTATQGTP
ncbi:PASTA domain-containing protein [Microbacterium sp. cx-59]|uniref:protein kinase domain-containing protein n=1 Tax=Microbacterium sp. cx-59 TaxID=2891207 RepID=UPI001E5E0C8C|nr:PASTA domain-containing protein [Microbacterium sp. cx-59]MCC4909791.1 protein kinase [Microbacterium sp. cx-59]